MNIENCRTKLCVLGVLSAALLITQATNAGPDEVRTVKFGGPMSFGVIGDGIVPADAPYAGREVIEVRINWDVTVADGYNAADIDAHVYLPIIIGSGSLARIDLNGTTLGWSGSGSFEHSVTTDRYNFLFGPVGTRWGWQALGPGPEDAQVTQSSIEIDYLVPEPATMGLLAIGGLPLLRRRRK